MPQSEHNNTPAVDVIDATEYIERELQSIKSSFNMKLWMDTDEADELAQKMFGNRRRRRDRKI